MTDDLAAVQELYITTLNRNHVLERDNGGMRQTIDSMRLQNEELARRAISAYDDARTDVFKEAKSENGQLKREIVKLIEARDRFAKKAAQSSLLLEKNRELRGEIRGYRSVFRLLKVRRP